MAKKLPKAQLGRIVKKVGKAMITKRPVKQVFGTAGAIAGGTAATGGVLAYKAKKEFAESEAKKKNIKVKPKK
jgi:hypothetical protein